MGSNMLLSTKQLDETGATSTGICGTVKPTGRRVHKNSTTIKGTPHNTQRGYISKTLTSVVTFGKLGHQGSPGLWGHPYAHVRVVCVQTVSHCHVSLSDMVDLDGSARQLETVQVGHGLLCGLGVFELRRANDEKQQW